MWTCWKKNAFGYLLALSTWGVTEPWIVHFIDQNNAPFSRKKKSRENQNEQTIHCKKNTSRVPVTVYAGIYWHSRTAQIPIIW